MKTTINSNYQNFKRLNCLLRSKGLYLCFAILLIVSQKVLAQQEPSYSMFMYTAPVINPAMAGSEGRLRGTFLMRQQWTGIEGAPQTQTFAVDALTKNERVGLGVVIMNDQIGVTSNLNLKTQYAYQIQFERGTLAMGLQAGMNNFRADYASVITNPGNSYDNSFSESENQMVFNFGSGVFYYSEKFYAGISVPYMLSQPLDGLGKDGMILRQVSHYYLNAGYTIQANENLKIQPSTFVKVAGGAPVQVDVNTNFWYQDKYGMGFSYRTGDSFATIIQFQIANQFIVGFAHDFIVSSMSRYTSGNNELMLRYKLPAKTRLTNQ